MQDFDDEELNKLIRIHQNIEQAKKGAIAVMLIERFKELMRQTLNKVSPNSESGDQCTN